MNNNQSFEEIMRPTSYIITCEFPGQLIHNVLIDHFLADLLKEDFNCSTLRDLINNPEVLYFLSEIFQYEDIEESLILLRKEGINITKLLEIGKERVSNIDVEKLPVFYLGLDTATYNLIHNNYHYINDIIETDIEEIAGIYTMGPNRLLNIYEKIMDLTGRDCIHRTKVRFPGTDNVIYYDKDSNKYVIKKPLYPKRKLPKTVLKNRKNEINDSLYQLIFNIDNIDEYLQEIDEEEFNNFINYLNNIIFKSICKIKVKQCECCDKYFITTNANKSYCDRPYQDGKTCSQIGPSQKFKDTHANEAYGLYKSAYNTMALRVKRGTLDSKDFNVWKEEAKKQRDLVVCGDLSLEEYKSWIDSEKKRLKTQKI